MLALQFNFQSQTTKEPVVAVLGDSAFGFSGMELETIARYSLPITFIIINNAGIGRGIDESSWRDAANNATLECGSVLFLL